MFFTVEVKFYKDSWEARFAFEAKDEGDALSKARGWGRYHSFPVDTVRARKATEHEAIHWLHNEYVEI